MTTPLSGRRAEAARNDDRILDAAREVFLNDPTAPISAVSAYAGVGISALYRRYPSKEHLLRELARDGLVRFIADLEIALAERGDPWASYSGCLQRVLDGQSQALAQRLAGSFTPDAELERLAIDADRLYKKLHDRTRRAKAIRSDVTPADVVLLLEMIMLIRIPDADRLVGLRRRYLALILQSLHSTTAEKLPGPPVADGDLAARWRPTPTPRPKERR